MAEFNFWGWFDKIEAAGKASAVGQVMGPAGYHVEHTGGGCLTWAKASTDRRTFVWICDTGQGLGDHVTEPYLVGLYERETGDIIEQGECADLALAIAWCAERLR